MTHRLSALFLSLALLQGCGSTSPAAPTASPIPSPASSPTPTPPSTAPLSIAGAYRLTLTFDPACGDQFPQGFQARTYDVNIKPAGDHSEILFNSPTVVALPKSSLAPGTGSTSGGFYKLDFQFEEVSALDQPSHFSFVVLAGAANISVPAGSSILDGPLFAQLSYSGPSGGTPVECVSSSDHFNLSPR